jgi:hypothetical protein
MLMRPLIIDVLAADEEGEELEDMGLQPDLWDAPCFQICIWNVEYIMEDIRSTKSTPLTLICTGAEEWLTLMSVKQVNEKIMQCMKLY